MTCQQRLEVVVPFVHEIQAALLNPAVEIMLAYGIRVLEDRIVGCKNLHPRFFDRNASAAEVRRVRSELAAVKFWNAGVVLHNQSSSTRDEIKQLPIISDDVFLRVIGANAENDRAVLIQ